MKKYVLKTLLIGALMCATFSTNVSAGNVSGGGTYNFDSRPVPSDPVEIQFSIPCKNFNPDQLDVKSGGENLLVFFDQGNGKRMCDIDAQMPPVATVKNRLVAAVAGVKSDRDHLVVFLTGGWSIVYTRASGAADQSKEDCQ